MSRRVPGLRKTTVTRQRGAAHAASVTGTCRTTEVVPGRTWTQQNPQIHSPRTDAVTLARTRPGERVRCVACSRKITNRHLRQVFMPSNRGKVDFSNEQSQISVFLEAGVFPTVAAGFVRLRRSPDTKTFHPNCLWRYSQQLNVYSGQHMDHSLTKPRLQKTFPFPWPPTAQ